MLLAGSQSGEVGAAVVQAMSTRRAAIATLQGVDRQEAHEVPHYIIILYYIVLY